MLMYSNKGKYFGIVCLVTIFAWMCINIPGNHFNAVVFFIIGLCGLASTIYLIKDSMARSKGKSLNHNEDYVGKNYTTRQKAFVIIAASVFAVCSVLANYKVFASGSVKGVLKGLLLFIGGFFIINNTSYVSVVKLQAVDWYYKKQKERPVKLFLTFFLVAFLVFMFYYFTTVCPAVITTDSKNQISQAVGNEPYSNHHPYYHTQLIHVFIWIGQNLFNSLTVGISLYIIFQMFALALIFAYASVTLYEYGIKKWIATLIFLCYTFLPYNINISTIIWKDIFFGIFVLWTIIESFRLFNNVGKHRGLHYFWLWISGVGVCLFRSNGFAAFCFTFVLIVLWTRFKHWKICLVYFLAIVTGWTLKNPVLDHLGVESDNLAARSIQIQQISRVVVDDGNLSKEESEFIDEMLGLDYIKENYRPGRALFTLRSLRNNEEHMEFYKAHKSELNKMWIEIGKKNIDLYLYQWVDSTSGYWYPGRVTSTNDMPNQQMKKNSFGIKRKVKDTLFKDIWTKYVSLPNDTVLLFTVDIALYVWLLVLATWFAIYKKQDDAMVTFFAISIILSLLPTTPICNSFRYSYAIFTVTPFCLAYIAARGFSQKPNTFEIGPVAKNEEEEDGELLSEI